MEDLNFRRTEKLSKIEFRTKEKSGWPENLKIMFDSERKIIVDRGMRILLNPVF